MAMEQTLCKAGLVVLGVCMVLNLQPTDAQSNNFTRDDKVPGWGIALLVMVSLILLGLLCPLCCLPFCCRKREDDSQGGISAYAPHFGFGK